jgi:hypothetical protein
MEHISKIIEREYWNLTEKEKIEKLKKNFRKYYWMDNL